MVRLSRIAGLLSVFGLGCSADAVLWPVDIPAAPEQAVIVIVEGERGAWVVGAQTAIRLEDFGEARAWALLFSCTLDADPGRVDPRRPLSIPSPTEVLVGNLEYGVDEVVWRPSPPLTNDFLNNHGIEPFVQSACRDFVPRPLGVLVQGYDPYDIIGIPGRGIIYLAPSGPRPVFITKDQPPIEFADEVPRSSGFFEQDTQELWLYGANGQVVHGPVDEVIAGTFATEPAPSSGSETTLVGGRRANGSIELFLADAEGKISHRDNGRWETVREWMGSNADLDDDIDAAWLGPNDALFMAAAEGDAQLLRYTPEGLVPEDTELVGAISAIEHVRGMGTFIGSTSLEIYFNEGDRWRAVLEAGPGGVTHVRDLAVVDGRLMVAAQSLFEIDLATDLLCEPIEIEGGLPDVGGMEPVGDEIMLLPDNLDRGLVLLSPVRGPSCGP